VGARGLTKFEPTALTALVVAAALLKRANLPVVARWNKCWLNAQSPNLPIWFVEPSQPVRDRGVDRSALRIELWCVYHDASHPAHNVRVRFSTNSTSAGSVITSGATYAFGRRTTGIDLDVLISQHANYC